jgi:hypothetical protein
LVMIMKPLTPVMEWSPTIWEKRGGKEVEVSLRPKEKRELEPVDLLNYQMPEGALVGKQQHVSPYCSWTGPHDETSEFAVM